MAQITSGKVKVRCSKFECREEDIHRDAGTMNGQEGQTPVKGHFY